MTYSDPSVLPVEPDDTEVGEVGPVRRPRLGQAGRIGLTVLSFWIVVAILGPTVAPYGQAEMVSDVAYDTISSNHWLGTDYIGRDMFSRMLFGARVTLGLSLLATVFAFLLGVSLGLFAALCGPVLDMLISRIVDGLISMPTIMLGLVVIAALGSSIPVLILTAGFIYSIGLYRVSRALAMDIMVMDFVDVARARGENILWIMYKEILPNAVIPLLSEFGLRLVFSILFISGLSFLGLGVQPPTADWGAMVRENMSGMQYGSAAVFVPAISIATLTISINLLVDEISSRYGRESAGSAV